MDVKQARQTAKAWVETGAPVMPGLVAAHLVGGITTMPDDVIFPATKDLDMHLIFEEGSPALAPTGPFLNILESLVDGLAIEAGIRSIEEYEPVEKVLGNPEIAHHLTLDSLLYDPYARLAGIQQRVRQDYARRCWVEARIEHERAGLARARGFRDPARSQYGASGELNILMYCTTFTSVVLDVALLQAPRVGGQFLVRFGTTLGELDRADLFEDILGLFGLREFDADQAGHWLGESSALFDAAVAARSTPHFFQHKLHPHLRPYFVDSCRQMIDSGYPREAAAWMAPFILSSTDVLLADGSSAQQVWARDRQEALLRVLGIEDDAVLDTRFAEADRLFAECFGLAALIAAENPDITD